MLFRSYSQNCEDQYPLYGDTSKVDVLTPSRDSVYAKLERSTGVAGSIPDMIMWGDYATSEFSTRSQQFSSLNRNLHGSKLNYNVGNLLVSGFYGDNVQGFQRDNIAPDGTSGTYFLSQRLLLGGSEMNAGLACPDWPLCYGQLVPTQQMNLQVFLEWFHQYSRWCVIRGGVRPQYRDRSRYHNQDHD